MTQHQPGQHNSSSPCIECGGTRVVERSAQQTFPYGSAGEQVLLTASMPAFTCLDCGFEYFDETGEAARHAAVCRHLGLQTPEEIRKIREATGLTRAEFCQLTGFGSASLQRWEAGSILPNTSSDRLIFLLQFPENVQRLRDLADSVAKSPSPTPATIGDPTAAKEPTFANR